MIYLTEMERKALDLTIELWNTMYDLPAQNSFDLPETATDIHHIQQRILARSTRRMLENSIIGEFNESNS